MDKPLTLLDDMIHILLFLGCFLFRVKGRQQLLELCIDLGPLEHRILLLFILHHFTGILWMNNGSLCRLLIFQKSNGAFLS